MHIVQSKPKRDFVLQQNSRTRMDWGKETVWALLLSGIFLLISCIVSGKWAWDMHSNRYEIARLLDACNSSEVNVVPYGVETRGDKCFCVRIPDYYHDCFTKMEILNWQPFVAMYYNVFSERQVQGIYKDLNSL